MKKLMTFILIVISFNVMASDQLLRVRSKVERQFLDAPIYMDYHKVFISLQKLKGTPNDFRAVILALSYKKRTGLPYYSNKITLAKEEVKCLNNHKEYLCRVAPIRLPLSISQGVCKVQLTLKDVNESKVLATSEIRWGKCRKVIARNKRSSDLVWEDDFVIKKILHRNLPFERAPDRKISLNLINSGKSSTRGNFRAVAIGEDRSGRAMWLADEWINKKIVADEKMKLNFKMPITPWEWRYLCSIRIVADPMHNLAELKKKNNEKVLQIGKCLDATTQRREIDLYPKLIIEGNKFTLFIVNQGSVATKYPVPIQVEAYQMNTLRHIIITSYKSVIQGTGGHGIYRWLIPDKKVCRFKVILDPKNTIRERKRRNNFLEINNCKK